MWELIEELARDGTTTLLTTQYLEEADRLAEEIIVIDHGSVIARGTAGGAEARPRRRAGRDRARATPPTRRGRSPSCADLACGDRGVRRAHPHGCASRSPTPAAWCPTVVRRLDAVGVEVRRRRRPRGDPRRRVPRRSPATAPRSRRRRRRVGRTAGNGEVDDEHRDRSGTATATSRATRRRAAPSRPAGRGCCATASPRCAATSARCRATPSCWSSPRSSRSCSWCCSCTCSAARSTTPGLLELQAVRRARHLRPDRALRQRVHRRRHRRGPVEGLRRPAPVAADVPVGGAHRSHASPTSCATC